MRHRARRVFFRGRFELAVKMDLPEGDSQLRRLEQEFFADTMEELRLPIYDVAVYDRETFEEFLEDDRLDRSWLGFLPVEVEEGTKGG